MSNPIHANSSIASTLAAALRQASATLAKRWCERVLDRVDGDRAAVFSDTAVRYDVPFMICGIADYLENPLNEIAADSRVIAKAMELGACRHREQFDVYELLKEYELLGSILFSHVGQV